MSDDVDIGATLARLRAAVERTKCVAEQLVGAEEFGPARYRAGKRLWNPEEDAVMRSRYPDMPTADLAELLRRPFETVYHRAAKLGLHKSAAYMASPAACRLRRGDNIGAPYRFKKGQVPPNKGVRRPGWHAGRMKETQFKKGQVGVNTMPIGALRLVDGYVYRKISAVPYVPYTVNWKPEHVLMWEAANGPMPPKHAVAFKNGDRYDIRLDNLELISRRELMARNTVHNLPAPLPEVVQLIGALKRKIKRREKPNEKQDRRSA